MKGVMTGVENMVNAQRKALRFDSLYENAREAGVVNNRRQLKNALYALAKAKRIEKTGSRASAAYGPKSGQRDRAAAPGQASAAAARWALTSDGAFLLIGSSIEIPRAAARSLVDFVRTLDQGAA